jgi:hypothetical protein
LRDVDEVLPLSLTNLNFPSFEPSRNRTIFCPFTKLLHCLTLTRIDLFARFSALPLRPIRSLGCAPILTLRIVWGILRQSVAEAEGYRDHENYETFCSFADHFPSFIFSYA